MRSALTFLLAALGSLLIAPPLATQMPLREHGIPPVRSTRLEA